LVRHYHRESVAIGTLQVAEGKISAFNGAVYIQVTDIQASFRKSTQLGGTMAPLNRSDTRMAAASVITV
jgi:hypothetical protein